MRPVILSVLLVVSASFARAEDITTTESKVFKNSEVIRFEPDGLVIKHDGGTNWVGWKELPTATRKRFQAEARKRKEEEIQKLKRDLGRAEAEAARLKEDNGQPETGKQPQAEKSGGLSARRTTGEERGRPVVELPPLKPDDIVDAAELVQQFKNDPTAADRRYDKKTFHVKGVIERFEPWCCSRKRSSKLKIQGTKKAPGSKVQIPTFILLPARPGFASFPAHPEAARSHSLEIVFAGANPNLPDATFIT